MAEAIVKKDWVSNFTLIGVPKVNDYTYKIDEKSQKSSWIYNSLNLGVDCGEKHGVVYAEMMGGYSDERDNIIYVHGKKEDGSDDFENRFEISWDDRFDEDVIETMLGQEIVDETDEVVDMQEYAKEQWEKAQKDILKAE